MRVTHVDWIVYECMFVLGVDSGSNQGSLQDPGDLL